MNLAPNKTYTVTKKIKIHTKPLQEVIVSQTGLFVKETKYYLIFHGYKVRKDCVVAVKQEEKRKHRKCGLRKENNYVE